MKNEPKTICLDYKFVMGELSMLRTLRDDLKEALHIEGDIDE
jgi:hypothetical protein